MATVNAAQLQEIMSSQGGCVEMEDGTIYAPSDLLSSETGVQLIPVEVGEDGADAHTPNSDALYPVQLLHSMAALQEAGHFCDIILKSEVSQEEFMAHGVVLGAASSYIKQLLVEGGDAPGMRRQCVVPLQSDSIRALLQYMYSGDVSISPGPVLDELYPVAVEWRLDGLARKCQEAMNPPEEEEQGVKKEKNEGKKAEDEEAGGSDDDQQDDDNEACDGSDDDNDDGDDAEGPQEKVENITVDPDVFKSLVNGASSADESTTEIGEAEPARTSYRTRSQRRKRHTSACADDSAPEGSDVEPSHTPSRTSLRKRKRLDWGEILGRKPKKASGNCEEPPVKKLKEEKTKSPEKVETRRGRREVEEKRRSLRGKEEKEKGREKEKAVKEKEKSMKGKENEKAEKEEISDKRAKGRAKVEEQEKRKSLRKKIETDKILQVVIKKESIQPGKVVKIKQEKEEKNEEEREKAKENEKVEEKVKEKEEVEVQRKEKVGKETEEVKGEEKKIEDKENEKNDKEILEEKKDDKLEEKEQEKEVEESVPEGVDIHIEEEENKQEEETPVYSLTPVIIKKEKVNDADYIPPMIVRPRGRSGPYKKLPDGISREVMSKPYKCRFCAERHPTMEEAEIHVTAEHQITEDKSKYIRVLSKAVRKGPNNYMYKCLHEKCTYSHNKVWCLVLHRYEAHHIPIPDEHKSQFFECMICNVLVHGQSNLNDHIAEEHTGERSHICEKCGADFVTYRKLKDHMVAAHTEKKVRMLKCPLCEYTTSRIAHLTRHKLIHFDETPFLCQYCGYGSKDPSSLRKHELAMHLRPKKPQEVMQCEVCKQVFKKKACYERHMIDKHNVGNVVKVTCDLCPSTFLNKNSLRHHVNVYHGNKGREKKFKCVECNYASPFRTHLERHVRKHSGLRPFQCPQCPFKCSDPSYLPIHMRRKHPPEDAPLKPPPPTIIYLCELCQRKFIKRVAFLKHLKGIHGIDTPASDVCNLCGLEFYSKQSLYGHKREVHGIGVPPRKYRCQHCNYTTMIISHLHRHNLKHTGERPLQCPHCHYSTTDEHYLSNHIKRKHRDVPTEMHLKQETGEPSQQLEIPTEIYIQQGETESEEVQDMPTQIYIQQAENQSQELHEGQTQIYIQHTEENEGEIHVQEGEIPAQIYVQNAENDGEVQLQEGEIPAELHLQQGDGEEIVVTPVQLDPNSEAAIMDDKGIQAQFIQKEDGTIEVTLLATEETVVSTS